MEADKFLDRLASERAVLVSVHATQGSVPREAGAWMAVFADEVVGTVGGGHLELQAIGRARHYLQDGSQQDRGATIVRYALGPGLGQCCGGVVQLRFEAVQASDRASLRPRLARVRQAVGLFGGGHVGKALIRVLASLPFEVSWIDSRDEVFPDDVSASVTCEHSDPVQGAVARLAAGTRVLIMSFSHAEDLEVLAACLLRQRQRGDLPFIGLIGSKTKWASFRQRLLARGFSEQELCHVTCPIGVPGITDKAPAVIAVAVAAQLLLLSAQSCGKSV